MEQLKCPGCGGVHFDLIPIRNLVSNQDYQRDLSESHITKTIRDFDLWNRGTHLLFHDAHLFFCSHFFHNIIVLQ